jgi:hypothetical protein
MNGPSREAARYRFGDSSRSGMLLGLSTRQGAPLVAGMLWLALALMVEAPLVGIIGLALTSVVSFGRWRHTPLYDIAAPGVLLSLRRLRGRSAWTRRSLIGAGSGFDDVLPPALAGLELIETSVDWAGSNAIVGVVRDRAAGTVSMVIGVLGDGFAASSALEQDAMLAGWGAALAPLARDRCPVTRVTWQEWAHPVGVGTHRQFLSDIATRPTSPNPATADYTELLDTLDRSTIEHGVLLTVTVDLRRVSSRRGVALVHAALVVLSGETELLAARLSTAGLVVSPPLSPGELATAVRVRSDPTREHEAIPRSLAAIAGRGVAEWGPMAVECDWFHARVDSSIHRTYRIVGWPMLPVPADWLAPLLTGGGQTRTLTVVMEPVPIVQAARAANRHLTSLETDRDEKQRKGFRPTARERRRIADIETREEELAAGHPEFRHVGLLTVTAASAEDLDDACAQVEQDAAQSMLDIRPVAARQGEGWVASLPLGRSVRRGIWA